jgi:hypothetical protein
MLKGLILNLSQRAQINLVPHLFLCGCERNEDQSNGAGSGRRPEAEQVHDIYPFRNELCMETGHHFQSSEIGLSRTLAQFKAAAPR